MSKSTFYLRCSYEIGIARSGSCRLLASVNNIQHSSTNTGVQFYIHTNTNTTVHPCIHLPGISFWLWLNLISQHSSRSRCWLTVVETEQQALKEQQRKYNDHHKLCARASFNQTVYIHNVQYILKREYALVLLCFCIMKDYCAGILLEYWCFVW